MRDTNYNHKMPNPVQPSGSMVPEDSSNPCGSREGCYFAKGTSSDGDGNYSSSVIHPTEEIPKSDDNEDDETTTNEFLDYYLSIVERENIVQTWNGNIFDDFQEDNLHGLKIRHDSFLDSIQENLQEVEITSNTLPVDRCGQKPKAKPNKQTIYTKRMKIPRPRFHLKNTSPQRIMDLKNTSPPRIMDTSDLETSMILRLYRLQYLISNLPSERPVPPKNRRHQHPQNQMDMYKYPMRQTMELQRHHKFMGHKPRRIKSPAITPRRVQDQHRATRTH